MSYLQFSKNNQIYTDKLNGDNDLHIFDIGLTNVYLDKYNETIHQNVVYDDIIAIQIFKNADNITRLPNNLKYLYIKSGTLETLPISPEVAANIEVIFLDFTNLHTFPDISQCSKLREITINHSAITRFTPEYNLPPNLKILNLRYNCISEMSADPFRNKPQLKINLSYNCLNERTTNNILGVNGTADLKMQNRYQFKRITHFNYNAADIRNLMDGFLNAAPINVQGENATGVKGNVLENNGQTVHLSSINRAINKSYANILEYMEKNKITVPSFSKFYGSSIIEEIDDAFKKANLKSLSGFLKQKLSEINQHSILKLTYINLLSIIWAVVRNHKQSVNLIERLHSEIDDSAGKCFTGCMNRLVNVLVGYVDGVVVSISLKEEIQMSIQRVMNKYSKLYLDNDRSREQKIIDYKNTKDNITTILNEKYEVDTSDPNNIISEEYKASWLFALQDYRPNATLCRFHEKVKVTDRDIGSTHYISYDNLIYGSEQNFDEERNPIGKVFDENNCVATIFEYTDDETQIHYPEKQLNYNLT